MSIYQTQNTSSAQSNSHNTTNLINTINSTHNQLAIRYKTKEELLNSIISKQNQQISQIVRDEIFGTNDKQVEALVYGYCPMITSKKLNVDHIMHRQRLLERQKEIKETMRNLQLKQNALTQKEFNERMQLLQQTFNTLEKDMNSQPQALEIQQLLGFQKENRRHVMNLADFTSQPYNITKEQLLREQQQAQDFVKKISIDRQQFRLQMERIAKQKQEQVQEMVERLQKEDEIKKEQKRQEKKEKVQQLKEELKLREQQRKNVNLETDVKVYEILNAKPLYKKKEERFQEEQEKSFQERQEDQMKIIKQYMKPVELKELEEHRIKYLEAKRFKELQLQKERGKYLEDIQEKVKQDEKRLKQWYGSKTPKAVIILEREQQEQEEMEREKEEMKKKIQERVQNYSHYVREMYYPKISMTKKEELENLKSHIKSTIKSQKAHSQRSSMANLHQNSNKSITHSSSTNKLNLIKNIQSTERYYNNSQLLSPHIQHPYSQQSYIKSSYTLDNNSYTNEPSISSLKDQKKVKRVDWTKFENKLKLSQTPIRQQPSQFHDSTTDYLKVQRAKRLNDGVNINYAYIEKQLQRDDRIDSERMQILKDRARQIERKAEMDEKVLRNAKNRTVEEEMAVNDMYLDAITAKLKLLDKI